MESTSSSTEAQTVETPLALIQPRRVGFWASEDGRAAVDRFDAWAACRRIEALGGIALLAGSGGPSAATGSARGLGSLWLKAQDVDLTLQEWHCGWDGMERLLDFMYVQGSEEVFSHATYELAGGDTVRMMAEEIAQKGEPGRYAAMERHFGVRRTYDLGLFEDTMVDGLVGDFLPRLMGDVFARRRLFLSWQHELFAVTMLSARGIGTELRMPRRSRSASATPQQHGTPSGNVPSAEEIRQAEELYPGQAAMMKQIRAAAAVDSLEHLAGSDGVGITERDSQILRGAAQKVRTALEKGGLSGDDIDGLR